MAYEYKMTAFLSASIDFVSQQSCKIIQMVNMVSFLCPSCKVTGMVKLRPLKGSIKARRAINTYYLTHQRLLSDKCFQAIKLLIRKTKNCFRYKKNYTSLIYFIFWTFKSFVFPWGSKKKLTSIIKLSNVLKTSNVILSCVLVFYFCSRSGNVDSHNTLFLLSFHLVFSKFLCSIFCLIPIIVGTEQNGELKYSLYS